ncbi:MAG: glucose-1-phosphate thymidylyltransferase, partial [Myxococcota bacterium]|nr:glucose-1-phosphate thymidylyltransferase [Myxococcota bacterium]
NSKVIEAEIENSILLEDVTVNAIVERIDTSLIGKGASIGARQKRPKSISFVLGDRSHILL